MEIKRVTKMIFALYLPTIIFWNENHYSYQQGESWQLIILFMFVYKQNCKGIIDVQFASHHYVRNILFFESISL